MGKTVTAVALLLALGQAVAIPAQAGVACETQSDQKALKTAALQQEMMVAALVCKAAGAYNEFVLSHQTALQESDRVLLAFFVTSNPRGGFDDYNLYKTELANNASMRSLHDMLFCARAAANFAAAQGRPLEHVLTSLPHPVETGVPCRDTVADKPEAKHAARTARADTSVPTGEKMK